MSLSPKKSKFTPRQINVDKQKATPKENPKKGSQSIGGKTEEQTRIKIQRKSLGGINGCRADLSKKNLDNLANRNNRTQLTNETGGKLNKGRK